MGAFREAINLYRKIKEENKQKKRLVQEPFDYVYLTKLLNTVCEAKNANALITIKLLTGPIIELRKENKETLSRVDRFDPMTIE